MQGANFNQGAFEGDRAAGINQNQFGNNYAMQGANFNQGAFEGDRSAGMNNSQFGANYGMNQAQFNQGAFEGDRAFGYGANQDQNQYNMQSAQNQYNMQNGLVGVGFDAAGAGANLATGYGQNMANLYTGMGDAQAAATMAKSQQRRGFFGDLVETGTRFLGV